MNQPQPNVVPFSGDNAPLHHLTAELEDARNEAKAAALRVAMTEKRILEHPQVTSILREEGTATIEVLKIVTGYNRTWDQGALKDIKAEHNIDDRFWPFKSAYSEVRTESKIVEKNFPDLWVHIADALTLKKKKPSITIVKADNSGA